MPAIRKEKGNPQAEASAMRIEKRRKVEATAMRVRSAKRHGRQVEAGEEPISVQRASAKKGYKAASDNAGTQLAMLRKRWKKICENPECDEKFEGLAITSYCSDECRFRAAYLRRIAK